MYTKYLYASPKGLKDERFLIGAEVINESNEGIRKQEIYIGKEYSLEDFLKIVDIYKIKTKKEDIINEYNNRKASSIIYFYTICKFSYLMEGDIVVINQDELNEIIASLYDAEEKTLNRKKDI